MDTVDDILRRNGLKPLNLPDDNRKKRKKEVYDDFEDEEEEEYKVPPRKKSSKREVVVEEEYSDEEYLSNQEENHVTIRRKTKSTLDKEGVKLIESLLKFCPKRGDSEQLWQHIKKCITLPAVQLYTKAAVINYLKRKGVLE